MTTYHVCGFENGKNVSLYRGTSIRKARQVATDFDGPAYVCYFVKWNIPMPICFWNDRFEVGCRSVGYVPYQDMTSYPGRADALFRGVA